MENGKRIWPRISRIPKKLLQRTFRILPYLRRFSLSSKSFSSQYLPLVKQLLSQGKDIIPTILERVRIRGLAAKDYAAVKKIERIIVDEYLQFLEDTGKEDPIKPWITPDYFNHYVRTKASFVAELGRNIVGFILSQPTSYVHSAKREIWLEYIAVLPENRRTMIGTRLMSDLIAYAKRNRISLLYTTLNPNNAVSIEFLMKHGFEIKDWKQASRKLAS